MSRTVWALAAPSFIVAAGGAGTDGAPAASPIAPAPTPPPTPTTVTVTPETAELMSPGTTVQLGAEVRDQRGQVMTGVVVTWASLKSKPRASQVSSFFRPMPSRRPPAASRFGR